MRNGNEEIRNGNEEIRLSMGKLVAVHASQKLTKCLEVRQEVLYFSILSYN